MDGTSIIALAERLASSRSAYGSSISPRDNMCSPGGEEHYYSVGQDGIWNIVQSMMAGNINTVSRILDFPSGFGRVTRFIRAAFPDVDIDVGDIWQEAVDSCAETYKAQKIEVKNDLRTIVCSNYNVIFCGSLLTHFNETKGKELLDFFVSHLDPGGIVIVTCSGRKNIARETTHFNEKVFQTRERLDELKNDYWKGRYAFIDYPWQPGYGRSFTPISWFHSYVVDRPELAIVRFSERGWDDNQDVITIKRY